MVSAGNDKNCGSLYVKLTQCSLFLSTEDSRESLAKLLVIVVPVPSASVYALASCYMLSSRVLTHLCLYLAKSPDYFSHISLSKALFRKYLMETG